MNRIFPTFLLTAVVSLLFVFCSSNDDNSVTKEEEETTDYDLSSLLSKFEGTGLSYAIARTGYFADDDFKKTQDEAAFIHTENFILVDTDGFIRGVYNGTIPLDVERLIRHIEILKKEI